MLQLTYTSLENGYKIERVMGNVSQKAAKTFSGIGSHCKTDEVLYAMDYTDEWYTLLKSVPYGVDAVGRSRCYVHGYMFPEDEWEKVFSDCGMLLGADYFAETETDELKPVEEVFKNRFIRKSFFQNLPGLIECVYDAVFAKKTFEVLSAKADSIGFTKELMLTIYENLPLSLRRFVTFSSSASRVIRTVTVTDKYSKEAKIKFDSATGDVSGVTGKYRAFVNKLFTDEKELYIEKLEQKMRELSGTGIPDENHCDLMIMDILPEAERDTVLTGQKIVDNFTYLLFSGNHKTVSGAKLADDMLKIISGGMIETPVAMDEKLFEAYHETDYEPFRLRIADYLAHKYVDEVNDNTIRSLFDLKARDVELFCMMTESLLASPGSDFVVVFADVMLKNPELCADVKEYYSEQALKNVCAELARRIVAAKNRDEIFSAVVRSQLHTEVMQFMLAVLDEEAVFWDYYMYVYTTPDAYYEYRRIKPEILNKLELRFYSIISNYEVEALYLLRNVYELLGEEEYCRLEKLLLENGQHKIIEKFYISFFLENSESPKDLEEGKKKLIDLGVSTLEYCMNTGDLYIDLCVAYSVKKKIPLTELMIRIQDYTEGACDGNSKIEELKKKYWDEFSWKKFDFSAEDVKLMYLEGNAVSELAWAVSEVAEYLSGKDKDAPVKAEIVCGIGLCDSSEIMSGKDKNKIIRRLVDLSDDPERAKEYLYGMTHPSVAVRNDASDSDGVEQDAHHTDAKEDADISFELLQMEKFDIFRMYVMGALFVVCMFIGVGIGGTLLCAVCGTVISLLCSGGLCVAVKRYSLPVQRFVVCMILSWIALQIVLLIITIINIIGAMMNA